MEFPVDTDILIQSPQIMGKSPKMLKVFKGIGRVAIKDLSVLISGENGTFKELVAKAIHYNSLRLNGPFVAISFTSILKDLTEAELFGYEKGAFSGATGKKIGKIEEANGGTLFIDEISEIDTKLQLKLLRFILDKEFSPLNSNNSFKADVRIIVATNKDLKEAVANGKFIEDLYNNFNHLHIKLPPLRERKEDILPLAKHFLKEAIRKYETEPKELSKDAKDFLTRYDWPGNVRELENTIKRATVLSRGAVIEKKDLLLEDIGSYSIKEFLEEKLRRYLKEMTKLENCYLYETVLSEVESSLITIVLKETGGNQLKAAKTLGINRNTLRAKIKEYKIRI
ncbi:MAG: sigma-54 dependent transcriptional regulator [Nitrospirota bacterium]|nr:sigma-54 dependent transcriptional regulator [Nitrospirota bacterium]